MFNLSDRKFLITGASSGIGRAIAQYLHKAGASVCVSGTKVEALETTSQGLMRIIPCDLRNSEEVSSLVERAQEALSGLDGLVCSAGITKDKLLMRMTDDDWYDVLEINLSVTFKLNRSAAKIMAKNRWGRIINLSSVVASTGNPGQVNYTASKAGILAMSKSIAREFASRNITVNCIAPGFIDTPMTAVLTDAQKDGIRQNIPMKRMGAASDVAAAALFLASEEASYITGQTFHVNGGMLME